MGTSSGLSSSFKARRLAQQSEAFELLAGAERALETADLKRLEDFKEMGFSPWRGSPETLHLKAGAPQGGGDGKEAESAKSPLLYWARAAMREKTGASLEWLTGFEGFLAELPACEDFFGSLLIDARECQLEPIFLMLDMYQPRQGLLVAVLKGLMPISGYPELILRLFDTPWFKSAWEEPLAPPKKTSGRFVVSDLAPTLWEEMATAILWSGGWKVSPRSREEMAKIWMERMPAGVDLNPLIKAAHRIASNGSDVSPVVDFIDFLAGAAAAMKPADFLEKANSGPRELWKHRLASIFLNRYPLSDTFWGLGGSAVFGANPENIKSFVEKGWIQPFVVECASSCEPPGFAAYNKAIIEMKTGRSVDMSSRFEKIQKAIEQSVLPENEKSRLLVQLSEPVDIASSSAPDATRLHLPAIIEISPQVLLLSRAYFEKKEEASKGFYLSALALSKGGFALSEGVEQARRIGLGAKAAEPGWLRRALEVEALEQAASRGRAPAPKRAL